MTLSTTASSTPTPSDQAPMKGSPARRLATQHHLQVSGCLSPSASSRPYAVWMGLAWLMLLICAVACSGSGTSSTDDEGGAVAETEALNTVPPWIASVGSPTYAIRLNTAGDPVVLDSQGQVLLDLGLIFTGSYGEAEGEAGCSRAGTCLETDQKRFSPWTWGSSTVQGTTVTTLSGTYTGPRATAEAVWSIREGDPVLRLEVTVTWTVDTYPDREALMMTLPDKAAALARDLRFTRLAPGQTVHTDRWTPHQVVAGSGARAFYMMAHGLDGMEVESIKHGTALVMELDDARNHPFRPVAQCGSDDTRNTVHHAYDRHLRRQGESMTLQVEVGLGHTWSPVISRYPEGREAAVALIDTASTQDANHLSALLWGHSDPDDPRFGNGGFLGNNLTLTRSLAPTPAVLADSKLMQIAQQGHDQGLQFAAHTAGLDDPSLLAEGLTALGEKAHTKTWIDHDPRHECSSFQATGWRNSKLVEQMVSEGTTTVWSNLPTRTTGISVNVMRPERPEVRTPLLWRHARSGHDMMMFSALELSAPSFQRRLTHGALKKLARERGVLIARTRFESNSSDPTTPSDGALLARDGEALISSPALEQVLFELSDARQNGQVWVTTVDALTRWLSHLEKVELTPLSDGRLRLTNRGETDLKGLTLLLPGGAYEARLNDEPLTGHRVTAAPRKLRDTLVWFDLDAHSSALLTIEDDQGRRLQPLVPVRWNIHTSGQR